MIGGKSQQPWRRMRRRARDALRHAAQGLDCHRDGELAMHFAVRTSLVHIHTFRSTSLISLKRDTTSSRLCVAALCSVPPAISGRGALGPGIRVEFLKKTFFQSGLGSGVYSKTELRGASVL